MKKLLLAAAAFGVLVSAGHAQAQDFGGFGNSNGQNFFAYNGYGNRGGDPFANRGGNRGGGLLRQAGYAIDRGIHLQEIAYSAFSHAQTFQSAANQAFVNARAAFDDGNYRQARRDLIQARQDQQRAQDARQFGRQLLHDARRDFRLARFDEREYRREHGGGFGPPPPHHGGSPE